MRQWKVLVAPLLVAAAVGLIGCGTESNSGTAGPPAADQPAAADGTPAETAGAGTGGAADPCKLLTQEQATQLLGAQAEPGKSETGGIDGPMCTYAAGFNTVSVVVTKYTSEAEITSMYDTAGKMLGSKVEYEKVSGIGEAAYYAKGMNLAFLHKGRVYYVAVFSKGNAKSEFISAAKMVLGNLG
jgi:hypothetical protein